MRASVVISTRNRARLLELTLRSLQNQTMSSEQFEIIVVNHGSTDGTPNTISKFSKTSNIRHIKIPFDRHSISVPKNAGLKAASGEIVIFVDDSVLCNERFLEEHILFHCSRRHAIACGPIFGWDVEEEDDFWRQLAAAPLVSHLTIPPAIGDSRWSRDGKKQMPVVPWLSMWGANFSAKKKSLVELGGFDETFSGWGWDDLELGYRLVDAGCQIDLVDAAWCLHYPHKRLPLEVRLVQAAGNWLRTYNKHRSPILELWGVTSYWDYGHMYQELTKRIANSAHLLPGTSGHAVRPSGRVALLGFRSETDYDGPHQLISPDPRSLPNLGHAIHSFGIRTPFEERHFDEVIVSNYPKIFGGLQDTSGRSIASYIYDEAHRIGKTVTFHK